MSSLVLYHLVILLLGAGVIWRMTHHLKESEKDKIKRLKKRKRFVLSAPNVDDDNDEMEELRERRIKSVETKFALFRKIAIPGIVCLLGILITFPLLPELPKTFISIGLTGIGVILGIACKSPIENLAAGFILSFTQPLRIGDTVFLDGEYGVVEDIGTTHTTIQIWDYRRLVVSNSSLLAKQFINYSLNDKYVWAYVEFYVSYDSDIELVEKLAKDIAQESEHFADFDDPAFWVMDFDKHGMKCWLAAWAENPSRAWDLKAEMRTKLAKAFKDNNITMHYYQVKVKN